MDFTKTRQQLATLILPLRAMPEGMRPSPLIFHPSPRLHHTALGQLDREPLSGHALQHENILWHTETSRSGYTQPMICLACPIRRSAC